MKRFKDFKIKNLRIQELRKLKKKIELRKKIEFEAFSVRLRWLSERVVALVCVAALDISIGVFSVVALAKLIGFTLGVQTILWGIFSALWLDIDAVLYWSPKFISRIIEWIESWVMWDWLLDFIERLSDWSDRWTEWIGEHRNIIHHPVMVIAAIPIIWGLSFNYFYILIFFAGSFTHLIHDSVDNYGIKWLYPFSRKRYGLNRWRLKVMNDEVETEADWFDEISSRPFRLFIRELVGASALLLLSIFALMF